MIKAGAPPKFKEAHVNWVFWKIASDEPMGRKRIVEETGLGEGSIRTILERLEEYDLVTPARSGRALTDNGRRVVQRLRQLVKVKNIEGMDMTKKPYNCLVLVKGAGKSVQSGMEQRDAAIAIGKSGATTLVVEKGNLIMPGFDVRLELSDRYPDDVKRILNLLRPDEGDVVVVGSENSPQSAEEAAWVAASTLLS